MNRVVGKTNPILLSFYYIMGVLVFYFFSYNFFVKDFKQLQEEHNRQSIYGLLSVMDTTMKAVQSAAVDYSTWDDTYEFIQTRDKQYLYENFREGTMVLEDLNLNFMIFSDKSTNEVVYSKYNNRELNELYLDFENNILDDLSHKQTAQSFYQFQDMVLYVAKSPIMLSDGSGQSNGYLYAGRVLNSKSIKKLGEAFSSIDIVFKNRQTQDEIKRFESINTVRTNLVYDGSFMLNVINFYDEKDQYIFSLDTLAKSTILNNGKDTIYIFNGIIALAFMLVAFILYKKQEALRKSNAELYELSYKDSLTKINNRRSYFILSEKYLKRSIKGKKHFAVLMIDLDNFKHINDKYGHSIGDKILIQFTQVVNTIIDDNCIFGRIGGEEFCISFYAKSVNEVTMLSEKIRTVCEQSPLHIHDQVIHFTVSLGLAQRGDLDNIDKILKQADGLLYTAKNNGRNKLIRCSDHGSYEE